AVAAPRAVGLGLGLLRRLARGPVAELARLLEVLRVDARAQLGVVARQRLAAEQRLLDLVDALGERALLRAARALDLLVQRGERLADLGGRGRHLLELARREAPVVADGRIADQLADLLRVLGRDRAGDVDEETAHQLADVLERRERLLLGPVGQAAGPELVVLVEVPLLALREVVAAALEPALERGERLVAVDVDPLVLRLDLVLELVQVLRPGL